MRGFVVAVKLAAEEDVVKERRDCALVEHGGDDGNS